LHDNYFFKEIPVSETKSKTADSLAKQAEAMGLTATATLKEPSPESEFERKLASNPFEGALVGRPIGNMPASPGAGLLGGWSPDVKPGREALMYLEGGAIMLLYIPGDLDADTVLSSIGKDYANRSTQQRFKGFLIPERCSARIFHSGRQS
jgi:hypothetical protein